MNHQETLAGGFDTQQILSLGQLVALAYSLFDNDESASNPNYPTPFLTGYTPIANLQACDKPGSSQRVFYGHLCRLKASPGVLVLSVRGTSDFQEAIDDLKFFKEPYSSDPTYGEVEVGFKEIFATACVSTPGNSATTPLCSYLATMQPITELVVVGHSLGSSIATLIAFEVAIKTLAQQMKLLTFASPRTGDRFFSKAFDSLVSHSLRIVNKPDEVPRVPPEFLGYQHVETKYQIDSKVYPDLKQSLLCYHSLGTYLHVLSNGDLGAAPNCVQEPVQP